MCEMKIFGLKFVVYLGTLVQDGLAHMRGVSVSAKAFQLMPCWHVNTRKRFLQVA